MKKMKNTILTAALVLCAISIQSCAQTAQEDSKNLEPITILKTPNVFPELIHTNIPGAPKLGTPQLIMGDSKPVMGEGYGWAAPAVYDWDDDGKKDLLIGEFGSGREDKGVIVGNFSRVYLNKGTDVAPAFNDDLSYYALGDKKISSGTPLSVYTWCCIPFTPRFKDLDNDGYTDLLTGQYNPGLITWFRGSENGFLPGIHLEEAYDALAASRQMKNSLPITDPEGTKYWTYSAADFGDFDNDGDQDMIVGGGALRICENIGTKTAPKFGKRELLLDTQGQQLEPGGLAVPYVVDWDGDGVLDILMTDSFSRRESVAVTFFRGLKTPAGSIEGLPKFEAGIPLFTAKNGEKEFPGAWLNVSVTDWNNDGVNDLLIGTSVATFDGAFNHELSWEWEQDTGISKKSPAYYTAQTKKEIPKMIKKAEAYQEKSGLTEAELEKKHYPTKSFYVKNYYGKEAYKNLAHQGYVYVMLGDGK